MTQNHDILKHLQSRGSITGRISWERYGCYRLSSVINRLRKAHGADAIVTVMMEKDGIAFAKYVWKGGVKNG